MAKFKKVKVRPLKKEKYAVREARHNEATKAWVRNVRRPHWTPDLPDDQNLATTEAVESEIEQRKALGHSATRLRDMDPFASRRGRWEEFSPPMPPLPQRNLPRAAKTKAAAKLATNGQNNRQPASESKRRPQIRKAISVSNLAGCSFIIAFSRHGMRAVHVWEELIDNHELKDGTTIVGVTSGQSIGRGHGVEGIKRYCKKYIQDFFAQHREQLEGGRVVVVLPHHIFGQLDIENNKWIKETGYRYDMRIGVLATEGDYPRYPGIKGYGLPTSSFVLIEGIPEMIKWSAAQGTGLKQLKRGFREVSEDTDHGLRSGRKRTKMEPVEQNFFEASYVPWNILDAQELEGPNPIPDKKKGTVITLYEPEYEIKEGKGKGTTCNRVQVWVEGKPLFNQSGKRPGEEFRWTW